MSRLAILTEMERLIRRDPARRGLIATEELRGPLCPGHLANAAADLASRGSRVVITTGFYIPSARPAAAETDGPPGAALLAASLSCAGMTVQIVTDSRCRGAVAVAVEAMGLPASLVEVVGDDLADVDHWFESACSNATLPSWSHLIAIERVGPSHTRESIQTQLSRTNPELAPAFPRPRGQGLSSAPDAVDLQVISSTAAFQELIDFEQAIPELDRNRCFNMRGVCLDAYTAPLHRLFERAHERQITTIGIGDGGNEIGMGSIPWSELRTRLTDSSAARILCRIATDWTIVCGVSNWGGMALAAAILVLLDRQECLRPWTVEQQQFLLQRMVAEGPAVDGITRLPDATVDGLPFLTYIQPWEGIRRAAGLA